MRDKYKLGGNKLINQTLEERIKSIKYKDIKRIMETPNDLFSYQVTSQNPKNQREVKYLVYRDRFGQWFCNCPAYLYSKDQDKPTCKHVLRVQAMIKESYKRQIRKAQKELSN
jgi:hypothetical protein